MMMSVVIFASVFMHSLFMLFFFGVIIVNRNFDDMSLQVVWIWNFNWHVNVEWDFDFLNHWHFDLLQNRILLNVMMVHCMHPIWFLLMMHLMMFFSATKIETLN